jgi:hypothetical protein
MMDKPLTTERTSQVVVAVDVTHQGERPAKVSIEGTSQVAVAASPEFAQHPTVKFFAGPVAATTLVLCAKAVCSRPSIRYGITSILVTPTARLELASVAPVSLSEPAVALPTMDQDVSAAVAWLDFRAAEIHHTHGTPTPEAERLAWAEFKAHLGIDSPIGPDRATSRPLVWSDPLAPPIEVFDNAVPLPDLAELRAWNGLAHVEGARPLGNGSQGTRRSRRKQARQACKGGWLPGFCANS